MQNLGKVLHSLTYFPKVKNEHFELKLDSFSLPLTPGKKYAPVFITSTVESNLDKSS